MEALRTLYMDGPRLMRVLRDGPALRVVARERADRLYPLRRLLRVVVSGRLEWDTDALLACAEHGVPVSFLSMDGELRACLTGSGPGQGVVDLGALLHAWLAHPEGLDRYEAWMRVQESNARLRLARRTGCRRPEASVLRKLFMQRARLFARSADVHRLQRQLYGLLMVEVGERLRDAGLDPQSGWLDLAGVSPVRDFANILQWGMKPAILAALKRRCSQARRRGEARASLSWADAVDLFESVSEDLGERAFALVRVFHEFVLEEMDPHGR